MIRSHLQKEQRLVEKQLNLPEVKPPTFWQKYGPSWKWFGWGLGLVGSVIRMLLLVAGASVIATWLVHEDIETLQEYKWPVAYVLMFVAYSWGWLMEKAFIIGDKK